MSRQLLVRCIAGLVLVQSPIGCATGTKPVDGAPQRTAGALPTDEGIPINQWYMSTTDADGARLSHYVAEYGVEATPGNTVIVLHGGWGAEHSYLVPVIKPLADQYRFVLYDQRGSLRSPATPPAKVTYANLIEDLDQLRQRLGLEKVTLMAHSMGNMLAYGYLRAHPDRGAGLVLVGPALPGAPMLPGFSLGEERLAPLFVNEVWPDFSKADAEAWATRTREFIHDPKRWSDLAIDAGLLPADWAVQHPPETEPDLWELYLKTDQQRTMGWRISFTCVNTYSGRNWRETLGGMVFYNQDAADSIISDPEFVPMVDATWPALKSFKGPVRVIIGTHDYCDLGPTFWPRLVPAIPNARLDTILNAGHSIWMDEPE